MLNWSPAFLTLITFYVIAFLLWARGVRRNANVRRANAASQEKVAQIIREAVGSLPASEPASSFKPFSPREQFLYVVVLCVGSTLIYLTLYALIDIGAQIIEASLTAYQQSLLDNFVSLLIPLIFGWLVIPLIVRLMILRPSDHRATDRELYALSGLEYLKWVVIFSASVAMFIILPTHYDWLLVTKVLIVYIVFCTLFWVFFRKPLLYFPQYWILSAFANANYDKGTRRTQHLATKYPQNPINLINRGSFAASLGQYAEAEQVLRQSLQVSLNQNPWISETMTQLGYVILQQYRYEEAIRVFEGAIKLNPKNGSARCGLAEVYLFQKTEPQRALEQVTHFMKTVPRSQVRDKYIWGVIKADEAWALALLGRHDDAQLALKQAFELTDKTAKPRLAGYRFREGKVFQIQGDDTRAAQSFQEVIQLDPVAMYGRQAQQELAALSR